VTESRRRGSQPGHASDPAEHNVGKGRAAEEKATSWLSEERFEIVGRNVRTAKGEIDVVALEGETLCFIEVKARGSHRYGSSLEAVDRRKQKRLSHAALLYLQRNPHEGPCRFDVLGLDPGRNGWEVTLIRDAFSFQPPSKRR